eukprot:TRINITY_DN511_c0_g11_i1.p1 TRINITY_DN511_c0_g11~~TRINITY_DN511_c0_g11_i1.p1  ORF type:complete len:786 (+),score=260.77 TRINITY_DN511_c0_g11_i1:105-2462(+)
MPTLAELVARVDGLLVELHDTDSDWSTRTSSLRELRIFLDTHVKKFICDDKGAKPEDAMKEIMPRVALPLTTQLGDVRPAVVEKSCECWESLSTLFGKHMSDYLAIVGPLLLDLHASVNIVLSLMVSRCLQTLLKNSLSLEKASGDDSSRTGAVSLVKKICNFTRMRGIKRVDRLQGAIMIYLDICVCSVEVGVSRQTDEREIIRSTLSLLRDQSNDLGVSNMTEYLERLIQRMEKTGGKEIFCGKKEENLSVDGERMQVTQHVEVDRKTTEPEEQTGEEEEEEEEEEEDGEVTLNDKTDIGEDDICTPPRPSFKTEPSGSASQEEEDDEEETEANDGVDDDGEHDKSLNDVTREKLLANESALQDDDEEDEEIVFDHGSAVVSEGPIRDREEFERVDFRTVLTSQAIENGVSGVDAERVLGGKSMKDGDEIQNCDESSAPIHEEKDLDKILDVLRDRMEHLMQDSKPKSTEMKGAEDSSSEHSVESQRIKEDNTPSYDQKDIDRIREECMKQANMEGSILSSEIDRLENELQEEKKESERLRDVLRCYEETMEKIVDEADRKASIEQLNAKLSEEYCELENSFKSLHTRYQDLKSSFMDSENMKERLQDDIKVLKRELEDSHRQYEFLKNHAEEKLMGGRKTLAQLRKQQEEMEKEQNTMSKAMATAEAELKSSKSRVVDLETSLERLQAEIIVKENEVSEGKKALEDMRSAQDEEKKKIVEENLALKAKLYDAQILIEKHDEQASMEEELAKKDKENEELRGMLIEALRALQLEKEKTSGSGT